MTVVDIVADIGEGYGDFKVGEDARLLPALTSANVACGFHTGDPRTMRNAVRACVDHGVAIGAHPGFPDLVGFGRRTMKLTQDEVTTDVLYQLGALDAFTRAGQTRLAHVAPHGRLGNLAVTERTYAAGVATAVEAYDPSLVILTQPGALEHEARRRGLRVGILGMIDRAYDDHGRLVPRNEANAVLHDPGEIVERALEMVLNQRVLSRTGKSVDLRCDSLLMHGDNGPSIEAAHRVRSALERSGVELRAVGAPPLDSPTHD